MLTWYSRVVRRCALQAQSSHKYRLELKAISSHCDGLLSGCLISTFSETTQLIPAHALQASKKKQDQLSAPLLIESKDANTDSIMQYLKIVHSILVALLRLLPFLRALITLGLCPI